MNYLRKTIGYLMVADGLAALIAPRDYIRKLEFGNSLVNDLLEYFAERPELTRGFSVSEIAIGLFLALK